MSKMQFELKGMKERRAQIVAAVAKIGDAVRREQRAMTPDEQEAFAKLQADFNALTDQMATTEASLAAIAEMVAAGSDGADPARSLRSADPFGVVNEGPPGAAADRLRKLAFAGWCRSQYGHPLTPQQRAACKKLRLNPKDREFVFRLGHPAAQTRDMGVGTGAIGGFLVPAGFAGVFDKTLKARDGVRAVCSVVRTDTGNPLPYPTVDDTTNVGEQVGENAESVGQDVAVGSVNFGAYKFGSKAILVSNELMQDSAFDMETMIADLAGDRIGRIQGARFTTGNGTTQPQGIVTGASAGVTAAGATAITGDDVVRLFHSVDPAYRDSPSFGFMMHDGVRLALNLLKDTQNRPLFLPSYREGQPDTLLGRPIRVNQFMQATVATATVTMLAGDFSKYVVRDAGEVRVRRLDERYAEKDQVGFLAFLRSDAKLLQSTAVRRLTQA